MHDLGIFIRHKKILLLGGGEVAFHKYQTLLKSNVEIKVIAKAFSNLLLEEMKTTQTQSSEKRVTFVKRAFRPQDIEQSDLVISALNDSHQNQELHKLCQSYGKLLNCVDEPQYSDFILPALIRLEDEGAKLQIAINTAGQSPVFASWLRSVILKNLPPKVMEMLKWSGKRRGFIKTIAKKNGKYQAKTFWHHWFYEQSKPTPDKNNEGYETLHYSQDQYWTESYQTQVEKQNLKKPKVYLVGAGVGSIDLLTQKALRLLAMADVVLYDALVGDEVLSTIRKEALKLSVGKRCKKVVPHSISQDEIHQLMIKHAKEQNIVVRLQAGDPLIFARGGEQIDALKKEGIEVEVVAGISAYQAAAAHNLFALTHRDFAHSLVIASLHDLPQQKEKWWLQFKKEASFSFFMGTDRVEDFAQGLCERGLADDKALVISQKMGQEGEATLSGLVKDWHIWLRGKTILKPALITLAHSKMLEHTLQKQATQKVKGIKNLQDEQGFKPPLNQTTPKHTHLKVAL